VGLLRREGQLTATRAGELLGESSGTCSFHLRQLAKYGLVEEAGGGTGRAKPWRATAMFTHVPELMDSPEAAEAAGQVRTVLAGMYFERLARWLERSPGEPEEWREAAIFGDLFLYVTADELADFGRKLDALVAPYIERQVHPELRPPGTRLVTCVRLAFPS
jgi:hypothetical protein